MIATEVMIYIAYNDVYIGCSVYNRRRINQGSATASDGVVMTSIRRRWRYVPTGNH